MDYEKPFLEFGELADSAISQGMATFRLSHSGSGITHVFDLLCICLPRIIKLKGVGNAAYQASG